MNLSKLTPCLLAFVLVTPAPAAAAGDSPSEAVGKPNIIFLIADDLGLGDVHAYDRTSTIPTPNIDRLASEGVRFTDAHSPSSVCTPSRYSVLTGRFPFRSGLTKSVLFSAYERPLLHRDHETVPEMLRRAGYRTAAFGKWHLGMSWLNVAGEIAKPGVGTSWFTTKDVDFTKAIVDGPLQHGFDHFFGVGSSINHGPYTFIEDDRVTELPTRFRDQLTVDKRPYREGWVAPSWDDTGQDVAVAQKALSFVSTQVETEPRRPFFMYYAALANHFPHSPPETSFGVRVRGQGGADDRRPNRNDKIYEFDLFLGQLRKRLEDPNQDGDTSDSISGDTLIVVSSDNGADAGFYKAMRGKKGDIFEGGHRVPMVAYWPGKTPGGVVTDKRVGLIDLYATFAALTGTTAAEGAAQDSRNMLPVLLGSAGESWTRGPLLQQASGAARSFAVLDGPWKLLVLKDQMTHLFNLDTDPLERKNLLESEPAIAGRLMKTYDRARGATMLESPS